MNKELIIRIDEMTNGEFSRRFIQPETPNGVFVEFTKPDLSMVGARK